MVQSGESLGFYTYLSRVTESAMVWGLLSLLAEGYTGSGYMTSLLGPFPGPQGWAR